jgi:PAS domain S-box-containing protein
MDRPKFPELSKPLSQRVPVAVLVTVAFVVVAALASGLAPYASTSAKWACNISLAACFVALAWEVFGFAKLRRGGLRWRSSAGLIALGGFGLIVTMVGILYMQYNAKSAIFNEWVTQGCGIMTYVAWAGALFLLPARRMFSEKRLPRIMDVALIVTALSAAGWFFLIAPQLGFKGHQQFSFWLFVAFPIADMLSVASVVAAISQGGPFKSGRGLLMSAICFNVAGDVIQWIMLLTGKTVSYNFIQGMWMVAALLGAMAALRLRQDLEESASWKPLEGPQPLKMGRALAPMLFLAALMALGLWGNWARPHSVAVIGLDVCCAVATVCALIRLLCLIKVNNDLAVSLAESNESLDRQVRERTRELEEQRAFLRSTIDALPSFIFATSADGKIVLANEAAGALLARSPSELVGSDYSALLGDLGYEVRTALEGASTVAGERQISDSDDLARTFDVSVAPILDHEGNPEQVLVVGNDVTVRKEAEKTLIAARDAAEQAIKVKAEFLANVSHEIRTPMNGVIGFTELLLSEDLPADHRDLASSIKRSGESLLHIINDILDVSKLEAGRETLQETPTAINTLCEDVADCYSWRALDKGLQLTVQSQLEKDTVLITDAPRLRQVLGHLLSNAIKFTPSGSVTVEVCMKHRRLMVSVVDTGIGIPADKIDSVFETFGKVDNSATRQHGGIGLGLHLCRQLVELLGGQITVQSTLGKGSRFTIDVPVKLVEQVDRVGPKQKVQLNGFRVLAVEDNPVNQKIVVRLLQRFGCEVAVVNNGAEALQYLTETSCDAILMDCQMPIMDGYEATKRIRGLGRDLASVPIIAVTANAMAGDMEKCLAAGMDDYVAKPVKPEVLAQALERVSVKRIAA